MPRYLVVVLVGTPANGFTLYGPFEGRDRAIDWADREVEGEAWEVVPLEIHATT